MHIYQGYYSWKQKSLGIMHQCNCSKVLIFEASLLRSSLVWILHDWILTSHIQIHWFSCLEHLKYEQQWEIVVCNLKWLMHGSSPPPLPILGGDLKISDQNNWGGPEEKIKFGGKLNLRGGLWTSMMSWLLC